MDNVRYQCRICGYVYDPAQGDAPGSVSPGTDFKSISALSWECPVCGAEKESFGMCRAPGGPAAGNTGAI
ncbi:MAG: rubredoxin [Treponema sp.]|nr:rubredoxin [Treponema sp.]